MNDKTQPVTVLGNDTDTPAHALDAVSDYASALDARRFRTNLERRQVNRDTLMEWVRDALVEGTDYGRIHVVKREQCPDGNRCTNPYHFSKPSLWKPGAEKICGMLGLNVSFPALPDYERSVLSGKLPQMILLRCVLVNEGGQIVAEGMGARAVEQDAVRSSAGEVRYLDFNKSIKMAEKSAMIDAVLRAGGLSEVFTQDLESAYDDTDPADPYAPGSERGRNPWAETANINMETHCPIGKWKGRRWEDVDRGYIEWLIANIDDKPDLIARAKRALADHVGDDPNAERPARPKESGSPELASCARALTMAKTIADLESAWNATPEKFRVPLRSTYKARSLELENTQPADDNTKDDTND
jgi:hypothetical protein